MDEGNRFSQRDATGAGEILPHHHLHVAISGERVRSRFGWNDLSAHSFRGRSPHPLYLSDQRPFWSVTHHRNARHPGRAETAERRRTCGRGCTNSEKTTNRIKTKMI